MRNVCATLLPIVSYFFDLDSPVLKRHLWRESIATFVVQLSLFNSGISNYHRHLPFSIMRHVHLSTIISMQHIYRYIYNIYIICIHIYACNSSSVKTCTLKLFSFVARAMNETRCNSGQLNKHWPYEKTSCKLQIINVAKKRLKLVFNMSTSKAIIIFDSVNVSPIY